MTLGRTDLPIRPGLAASQERAWAAIAAPGTWLSGERRVAVAAEVRRALECGDCARIAAALSPYGEPGIHETTNLLRKVEAEVVHRVVNDPGRLTASWVQSVLDRGVSDGEYIEIVGLVAMVMMLDTFARAAGLPPRPLPAPVAGEPTRYRPPGAKRQAAWVPLVEPEDVVESDGPMYPSPRAGYIYRSLSLVPQTMRDYWGIAVEHYLPSDAVYQFDRSIRAITRPQTEVLAARVSALHQCAY